MLLVPHPGLCYIWFTLVDDRRWGPGLHGDLDFTSAHLILSSANFQASSYPEFLLGDQAGLEKRQAPP